MFTILVIAGILCAVLMFKFLCGKFKVETDVYNFYAFTALMAIGIGLICAFLFQQLYNLINSLRTGEKFVWGGITFFGGLIGGVLTFVLIAAFAGKPNAKKEFWRVANLAAPCIVSGHAFGRYGCFCAGCCYGKPTDGFGFKFYGLNYKAIPTNLYEALFLTFLCAVMLVILFRFRRFDFLLILYGFVYAVFRFVIEYFRGDDRGQFIPGLSPSQFQAIILFLVAAALAVYVLILKKTPLANFRTETAGSSENETPGEENRNEPETAEGNGNCAKKK